MTSNAFKPVADQLAYLKKGVAEIIPENELRANLENSRKTGKPLRAKLGVDDDIALCPLFLSSFIYHSIYLLVVCCVVAE
jgi:hypothetical protein